MLNQQQKKAAETSSNQALVLAGAGSGKTRVLIERIAYLIEEKKVSPYEIMAFTFTRKAAGEIKSRLHERIGNMAYGCTLGTMHGIALNLIRRFGEFVTVNPHNLTVYSEWESTYLLREVAIDMGIYKKKKWSPPKKEIDAMFNEYYNTGIEPKAGDPLYGIFKAFMFRCKENNALTYGTLLIGFRALLDVGIKQYLHTRHLLVDEIQDINPLQWDIIGKIVGKDTPMKTIAEAVESGGGFVDGDAKTSGDGKGWNAKADLFIVGDISQSIYEWRGAVPEYLTEIASGFDVYRIENNYRSDANIVHAANRLIEHNEMRLPLTMVPFEDAQSEIMEIANVDSKALVKFIKTLIENSPDTKQAVLARVHNLLAKVSRLLEDEGIEHTYIGKKTALTNSEDFRRFHAFFKLIVNKFDNFSYLLVHNLLGVSRETYNNIRVKASQEHKSHFQAWQELPGIFDFATAHDEHGWTLKAATIYTREVIESRFNGHGKEDSLNDILNFVLSWIEDNPSGDIRDYLEWLATFDVTDELTEEQPMLSLMTIHSCKGLEFPTVIIFGANEGFVPSHQAIKAGDIEGERRLMYVAVTRAEDRLIITTRPEQSEDKKGNVKLTPKSRFIGEMKL